MAPRQKTRNGRPKSGGLGPFVFTQRYRFRGLQRRSFLPVLTLPSIDFSPGSKLVTNISASKLSFQQTDMGVSYAADAALLASSGIGPRNSADSVVCEVETEVKSREAADNRRTTENQDTLGGIASLVSVSKIFEEFLRELTGARKSSL